MIVTAAVLAILAFSVAFVFSGLLQLATGTFTVAQAAVAVLNDRALDDDAKERAAQAASTQLLVRFLNITLRAALVLAAPVVVIWLFDLTGLAQSEAVYAFLMSWQVIVATFVLAVAAILVKKIRR